MGDQGRTEIAEIEGVGYVFRPLHPADAPFDAFCFPMEREDFEAAAAEEGAWACYWIGAICSLRDGDGRFMLVEVVGADCQSLEAELFADRFDERPTQVDRRTLTPAPDEPRVRLWRIDIDDDDSENRPQIVGVIEDRPL